VFGGKRLMTSACSRPVIILKSCINTLMVQKLRKDRSSICLFVVFLLFFFLVHMLEN
jgi:hypothetical protein